MKKIAFLFLLSLPWGVGWFYSRVHVLYQPECLARFSFAIIDRNGEYHYSDGTFKMMSSIWGSGTGAYLGTVFHPPKRWPVHVTFTYDFKFKQGIATVFIRTLSPELGNKAPTEFLSKYVSPVLKAGETNRTRFILLDGKKMASGTTNFPRMVCSE